MTPDQLSDFPFDIPYANGSVTLWEGRADLAQNGLEIPGTSKLIYTLVPHPRVECPFQSNDASVFVSIDADDPHVVIHDGSPLSLPVHIRSINVGSHCPTRFEAVVRQPFCLGLSEEAHSIIFQVLNFWEFLATSDVICAFADGREERVPCLRLGSDRWQVEMTGLPQSKDHIREAKATEGFAVTHIGTLKRPHGERFTFQDAHAFLDMFHYFLGFVRGLWCGPTLVVGRDKHGEMGWWHASNAVVSPWLPCRSWLPTTHAEVLVDLFPSFVRHWCDPVWEEPLRHAIYWHVLANTLPNVDAGIILLQNALELLAWTYLGSKGQKRRGTAKDKIRRSLAALGIDAGIPDEPAKLLGQCGKLEDIPDALTKARNAIVHPDNRNRGKFDGVLPVISKLGLWCTELAMLKLLAYSGLYSNRLKSCWRGDEQSVPWADKHGANKKA
ncbi:MAG: hypothetical protein KAX19_07030 [Candidatus Brocadiae bacterium]|nr:hypothetical protein [Candidatus Brocadiia bacterium]